LSSAVPALGESIARRGDFEVSLAAFCAPGEEFQPEGFERNQLSFWPAARGRWVQPGTLRRDFMNEMFNASGVHIHGLWEQSTATAASTARKLGIPYIISAHGMLEPWALANKRLKKMLYAMLIESKNVSHATCLHALTQAEAMHFVRFGARSPIAIIPNGVNVPAIKDATLFLRRYPELAGKRLVLFMARLHPKKGLNLLLEAWSSLAAEHPNAHLVVAGPDSEGMQQKLEQYCIAANLRDRVSFPGMLQGAMKWSALAAAELFVLPSFSEGLSVGVLEAMGMGLPVIVTEPCNMPEVEECRTGWQIEPTLVALKRALREALGNQPNRNAVIGRLGARLVANRFSWTTVARQMGEVYSWVLGGPQPRNVKLLLPERSR
jgi:glycosyltransferase involved in cell wall biosynthesis